jgi:hypothetical protein
MPARPYCQEARRGNDWIFSTQRHFSTQRQASSQPRHALECTPSGKVCSNGSCSRSATTLQAHLQCSEHSTRPRHNLIQAQVPCHHAAEGHANKRQTPQQLIICPWHPHTASPAAQAPRSPAALHPNPLHCPPHQRCPWLGTTTRRPPCYLHPPLAHPQQSSTERQRHALT